MRCVPCKGILLFLSCLWAVGVQISQSGEAESAGLLLPRSTDVSNAEMSVETDSHSLLLLP